MLGAMRTCALPLSVALAVLSAALPASAATVAIAGETSMSGPTYLRPIEEGYDITEVDGKPYDDEFWRDDTPYQAFSFQVSQSGTYTFQTDTTVGYIPWDGVILLFDDRFDPLAPKDNRIATGGFNWNLIFEDSFVQTDLQAGILYDFVQSGTYLYENGLWSGTISGPGDIFVPASVLVPEPTFAISLAGVAGLALRRRRAAGEAA